MTNHTASQEYRALGALHVISLAIIGAVVGIIIHKLGLFGLQQWFLYVIFLYAAMVYYAPKKPLLAGCGHYTNLKGQVTAFGKSVTTNMTPNRSGTVEYCHDCLGKMAIRCAWCENPIFIGNPVTLYSPTDPQKVPPHAVRYCDNPLQLVGCLGWNCADTGADRSGFWMPDGKTGKGHVERVISPLEEVFSPKSPGVVVINSLKDIQEARQRTRELLGT